MRVTTTRKLPIDEQHLRIKISPLIESEVVHYKAVIFISTGRKRKERKSKLNQILYAAQTTQRYMEPFGELGHLFD